jgi:hypothetical protein
MYYQKIPVKDSMGEQFTVQDFDCLAHNVARMVRNRVLAGPVRIMELGTWSGQSTLAIAQPHVVVHCVSTWSDPEAEGPIEWLDNKNGQVSAGIGEDVKSPAIDKLAFHQFIRNTQGFVFRTVMPLICHPLDAAIWWPEKLDGIFINGDAGDGIVRAVIRNWSRHVRSGGTIYGVFKSHTVQALTGSGSYTIDGSIWRHKVVKGGQS